MAIGLTAQVLLAMSGRIQDHKRLGPWAFGAGLCFGITGLLCLPIALRLDPPHQERLIGLIVRMTVFLTLLLCAWFARRNPPAHGRFVILGMSMAFVNGIRKMGIPGVDIHIAFLLSLVVPVAAIIWDLRQYRRLLPATRFGAALIASGQLARLALENSAMSRALAAFLVAHSH